MGSLQRPCIDCPCAGVREHSAEPNPPGPNPIVDARTPEEVALAEFDNKVLQKRIKEAKEAKEAKSEAEQTQHTERQQ